MEPRARILVVDDEPAMLENCERILSREGYGCTLLADSLRFRDVMAEAEPDVVITDLRMPQADGMRLLAVALADDPSLPVIVITGHASVASAVAAIREGAFDYLAKPFSADQLLVAVDRAVRYRALTVENQSLRERVSGQEGDVILGDSAQMRRLQEQIRRAAPADANVLITGESGTGKELVARSLHAQSGRRDRPFIPVDCAALPEGLLESELFGHEKGAFTGAVTRREGLLAEANTGTVFLDELGELGPALQSKLLRTLEQRQIRRVGDARLIDLDIRVIAATNVDVEAAVAEGRLRADLYYRLNVVRLELPPLRIRSNDITLLMTTFLERFAREGDRPLPRVTADVWEALESYDWPGNVRELKNVAQRLVVMDDDGRITLSDLPETIRFGVPVPAGGDAPMPVEYEAALARAMRDFRATYIRRMLDLHDGNVTRAARTAGVSRRTFHRWIAELDGALEEAG